MRHLKAALRRVMQVCTVTGLIWNVKRVIRRIGEKLSSGSNLGGRSFSAIGAEGTVAYNCVLFARYNEDVAGVVVGWCYAVELKIP
jgi:hypothetical protein